MCCKKLLSSVVGEPAAPRGTAGQDRESELLSDCQRVGRLVSRETKSGGKSGVRSAWNDPKAQVNEESQVGQLVDIPDMDDQYHVM